MASAPVVLALEDDGVTIELVWRGPAWLGEGPLWHPQEGVLYWVRFPEPDVKGF